MAAEQRGGLLKRFLNWITLQENDSGTSNFRKREKLSLAEIESKENFEEKYSLLKEAYLQLKEEFVAAEFAIDLLKDDFTDCEQELRIAEKDVKLAREQIYIISSDREALEHTVEIQREIIRKLTADKLEP